LDAIPVEDGHCDAVFCCDVMEHIPHLLVQPVLRELVRVLRPGGHWFFSIGTHTSNWKGPDGENLHVTIQPPHWWLTTFDECGLGKVDDSRVVQGGVLIKGHLSDS